MRENTVEDAIRVKESDLGLGGIFDSDEVIVELWDDSMVTLKCDGGIKSGRNYDMRTYYYDLSKQEGFVSIRCNGYGEIFEDDEFHGKRKKILVDAGVWNDESS